MKVVKYGIAFILCVASTEYHDSSPYSMYGIGESSTPFWFELCHGRNELGVRENLRINTENPAGLTSMDTLKLIAETSAFAKFELCFTAIPMTRYGNFSILVRLVDESWNVGTVFGVSVRIAFRLLFQNQQLEGSPTEYYKPPFEGDGGWIESRWAAYVLMPNLSIGANVGYIFGNIMKRRHRVPQLPRSRCMSSNHADFRFAIFPPTQEMACWADRCVYGYKQRVNFRNGSDQPSREHPLRPITMKTMYIQYHLFNTASALLFSYRNMSLRRLWNQDYSVLTSGVSNVKFQRSSCASAPFTRRRL